MRSIFISVVRFPSVSSPATVVGSLLTLFILRSKTWSPAVRADGGARRHGEPRSHKKLSTVVWGNPQDSPAISAEPLGL